MSGHLFRVLHAAAVWSVIVRMRTKLADEPAKRPKQRRRAEEALAALLASDIAYDLFSVEQHEVLDRVRECFRELANPGWGLR